MRRFPAALLLACALAVLLAVAGCDYPEQGFFILRGMDAQGSAVETHIFQVEELVDDTDLTYGFTIHVYDTAAKTVYDLPFDNVPEFTRRGWLFGLRDSDYGRGDLALDLTHDDQMSFVGAWRAKAGAQAYALAGRLREPLAGSSRIDFSLPLPSGSGAAAQWQVETLSEKQALEMLGKLSAYKRVKGSAPDGLDPQLGRQALEQAGTAAAAPSAGAPAEIPKRYNPPPMGGRRS